MEKEKIQGQGCSCCNRSDTIRLEKEELAHRSTTHESTGGLTRADFLKVISLGVVGLSSVVGTKAFAEVQKNRNMKIVTGKNDHMVADLENKEVRISADVTKDSSKPAVADWGRRFQAFFGSYGGKMEKWFVFSTDVSRVDVNKAIQALGIKVRRQLPVSARKECSGLKATTNRQCYLEGDPICVTVRWQNSGMIVESALEDLIDEKIVVEGKEVIKPWTPHFIYHGCGETYGLPTGCIVCPSDCNGGLITDNSLPLFTTLNYYKVNWDRMPPVGSKVEVVLKSIYGPYRLSSLKA